MVTRELVQAELEYLNANDLSKVYRYIKQVEGEKPKSILEIDAVSAQDFHLIEDDEAWAHLWVGR